MRMVTGVFPKFFLLLMLISFAPAQIVDKSNCTQAKCHASVIDHRYVHEPVEDDCSSCHDGDVEQHPEAPGKEFTLADPLPDLCFGCHDENNTETFVHSPVKKGECLSCHDPHGSANKFFLAYNRIDSLCYQCHDRDMTSGSFLHKPVRQGKCTDCHNPHQSEAEALLQKPLPQLCFRCHSRVEKQFQAAIRHQPFEEDCLNCHEVHAAAQKNLLDEKVPELCLDCHDDMEDIITSQPVVHQPVTQGKACLNCHTPHGTNAEGLLLQPQEKLCLSCHNKTMKSGTKTLANIKARLDASPVIHDPVRLEGCTICHNPHGARYTYLLEAAFPAQRYVDGRQAENFDLCFDCHDETMIQQPIATSDDITRFRDGEKNLHYLHVHRPKGRNCTNCHDVHAAERPRLIPAHVPFGKWQMPIQFQFTKNGGTCLPGCHEQKSYHR